MHPWQRRYTHPQFCLALDHLLLPKARSTPSLHRGLIKRRNGSKAICARARTRSCVISPSNTIMTRKAVIPSVEALIEDFDNHWEDGESVLAYGEGERKQVQRYRGASNSDCHRSPHDVLVRDWGPRTRSRLEHCFSAHIRDRCGQGPRSGFK